MKLNGWHRLWILLSVVYFVLVTSYVILEFPKAETIPHQSEFYKKLSKKSAGMIWPTNYEDALALGGKDITGSTKPSDGSASIHKLAEIRKKYPEYNDMTDLQLADALYSKYYSDMSKDEYYRKLGLKVEIPEGRAKIDFHPIIEMPNGHPIEFNHDFSKEELQVASQEYWRVVEQKATEKRRHLLLYATFFWLAPCLVLYALGWCINWVYMGFKQKKDAQQNIQDRESR